MEHRIIELETRLAFQEKAMEDLNDALAGQQRQIDAMEDQFARVTALLARILPLLDQTDGNG